MTACKLCGGAAAPFIVREGFPIAKCSACGFMFALLPEGYDLTALYKRDSYWNEGGEIHYLSGYDHYWRGVRRYYEARLPRISALATGRRMLEIGCADGKFLAMARRYGFDVSGVEMSETMRERCRRDLGCPVYASIEELPSSTRPFDCVVAFEVIEHTADPIAFTNQVRELTAPAGLLALSTPNFECDTAVRTPHEFMHFSPPAHVCYFTAATLSACVEKAGFKPAATAACFAGQEVPMPAWMAAILRPMRRGKRRLRPGGLIGKILKVYLRRRGLKLPGSPDALRWAETIELYATRST
ncbi:MAG TPA: class I SAM-dependent methyltransferase [Candidatus Binataceae bacterium]|nr:class I SAM-dependent methyltransferase [Candidatus Binataceae bacterium]